MQPMLPIPDVAEPNLAVIQLTSYLHQVNPGGRRDTFTFWAPDGRPDLQAAQRFKDGLADRIAGADTAHLLVLEVEKHQVHLSFMPTCPESAVDPAAVRVG